MEHPSGYNTNSNLSTAEKSALLGMFGEEHSEFIAIGKALGPEGLDKLLAMLGGQKPHIPTPDNFWQGLAREARDEEMRRKFRGHNQQELAIEYEMSERQVRRILAAPARERRHAEPVKSLKLSITNYVRVSMLAQRYKLSARGMHNVLVDVALQLPNLDELVRAALGGQQDIFADADRTTDRAA